MERDLGNLVVRIDLDGERFEKGIATLNRQMKLVESEFKAKGAILANTGKHLDQYQLKADTLTRQLTLQQHKVEVLTASYQKSAQEKGTDARATQQLGIQLNRATAQLTKMEHELKQAHSTLTKQSSAWHRLSEQMKKAGHQIDGMGQHLSGFGSQMTTHVTAPIGLAGGAALRFAIHFEEAFAGVRKTIDATEAEFTILRQTILDMSKKIPVTAEEIAKVVESAGQLGIQKKSILQFTRTMINMGVATNLSSDEAANALARLANITQMPQQHFDRLGATVVALGNNLAATDAEITEMALRIAGAGHQVGLTEAQIVSLAGALSSVGIQAEAGGSSISRVMIEMANAVQQGGQKLNQLAKVAGLSSTTFKQSFEQDASQAMVSFIEGLGKMKDSGENTFKALQKLGLSEILVRDTLLRASGAGDLFRKSLELGSKAWQKNTALTKEANERYKTTGSQLTILWNRIKVIGIGLGDALAPALLDILDTAEPFIQFLGQMVKQFAKLDPFIRKTILQVGLLVVAIGPLASIVGGFASTFAPLITSLASVSTRVAVMGRVIPLLLNPVGAAIVAVGALTLAGVALYKNWEHLHQKFPMLMKVLRFTNPLVALVVGIKKAENAFYDIKLLHEHMLPLFAKYWDRFQQRVTYTVKAIHKTVTDHIIQIREAIRRRMGEAVQFLRNMDLRKIGINILTGLMNGITSKATFLYQKVKEIAHRIQSTLKKALDIHSPSRVMMEIGQFTGEGFAIGISHTLPNVSKQTALLAQAALPQNRELSTSPAYHNNIHQPPSSHYSITIPLHFSGSIPTQDKGNIRALAKQLAPEVAKAIQQAESHRYRAKGVIQFGH